MEGWRGAGLVVAACALVAGAPSAGHAQAPAEPRGAVDLFFDCQAPDCRDDDYFRRELPFVNWVVDRQVADVHVLITWIQTGGGGRLYTLAFLGLGDFEGEEHELTFATPADATSDDARSGLADRTRLGLVRFVQDTPAAANLRVTWEAPGTGGPRGGPGPGAATAADDPWKFWVFSVNGNAFVNGEATSKFTNFNLSFDASRTTETWKYRIESAYFGNVQRFDYEDDDGEPVTVEQRREDWDVNGLAVRSLTDRWSVGLRADVGTSTRENQDLRWSVRPGLEFNFFPYAESTRRSLTLQYLVGSVHYEYEDTTIFDRTRESRGQHSLTARLALVQPWGRWTTSVTGNQYLHDPAKYSVDIFGSFNIRIFRGFSVRMTGSYSWIRDQLYLARSGATEAEVLLRQLQLATSYRYFTSFGIEYRFGSIFNNVVNPRAGGGGAGGCFFCGGSGLSRPGALPPRGRSGARRGRTRLPATASASG